MTQILVWLQHGFITVGPFFILLGILIFVHELGHFAVAKYFKVRVETFSLGFGKKIFKYKKGDTTYAVSLIPAGGYVKMYGDDPNAEVPEHEKAHAFLHKPVSQRIWIVLAGPLMNFFFAVLLLFAIGMIGEQLPSTELGDINAGTAAAQAGFQSGDKVLSINGQSVVTWSQLRDRVENSPQTSLEFQVQRGEQTIVVNATPTLGESESPLSLKKNVGRIEGLTNESVATVVGLRDGLLAHTDMKNLSRIVSINGKEVHYFRELTPVLYDEAKKSGKLVLKVQEDEKPEQTIHVELQPEAIDSLGIESSELYLARIKSDSPAQRAGFIVGDKILKLGDQPITQWKQIIERVSVYDASKGPLKFQILRSGKVLNLDVNPEMTDTMTLQGKEEKRYTIGVLPALAMTISTPVYFRISNPIKALENGFVKTYELSQMVVMGLVRLVQNQVSSKNIGGMISIGRYASQSFEMGLVAFLKMMALISVNLFLLNLLPVPVLDGGHLVFFAIEAIKGSPLSLKKMEIAQQIGIILLMSLMAFAFFNDISNLIKPAW